MGVFKSLRRRKWRAAVNHEFCRQHSVDLRTVGEIIGAVTLRRLLDDEYELAPRNPPLGATNVTQMLAHVYRVDIASLATRDTALRMAPIRGAATRTDRAADRYDRNVPHARPGPAVLARAVAAVLNRS